MEYAYTRNIIIFIIMTILIEYILILQKKTIKKTILIIDNFGTTS